MLKNKIKLYYKMTLEEIATSDLCQMIKKAPDVFSTLKNVHVPNFNDIRCCFLIL